ncbi:MAG TPA: hypothetical protein VLG66_18790, partial [Alphaproteobacteria bacterium]|nr:hypothetical protein [Alphaproteobacteria bacterium]
GESGPIRIFTARPEQNRLDDMLRLNGAAFAAGGGHEAFESWFGSAQNPPPPPGSATVFYKSAAAFVPPEPAPEPVRIIFEDDSRLSDEALRGGRHTVAYGVIYAEPKDNAPPGALVYATSHHILPDYYSLLSRQVFLEVKAPAAETLGFEQRPQQQAEWVLKQRLAGAEGSVSCAELASVVALIDTPQARKDFESQCGTDVAAAKANGANAANGVNSVNGNGYSSGPLDDPAGRIRANRAVRPILR